MHVFPTKKFLPLNQTQIEERRSQLERYIQIGKIDNFFNFNLQYNKFIFFFFAASQDSQIVNSDIFNKFLLAAQQESHSDVVSSDCIDIYQLDWQPIRFMINGNENSQTVLKKFCQTIKIRMENLPYFSLYLVHRQKNTFSLLRRLQNFESPLLTLKTLNKNANSMINNEINGYKIIIYKSYWDINFDEDLYDDPVSLNIIYLQAIHDIANGNIIVDDDHVRDELNSLQINNKKLEVKYIWIFKIIFNHYFFILH